MSRGKGRGRRMARKHHAIREFEAGQQRLVERQRRIQENQPPDVDDRDWLDENERQVDR